MKAVAPLLRRPNSEVVFNFMFTMINWSASMRSPAPQVSLDALMPDTDWKGRLAAVAVDGGEDAAEARKEILVSCINEVLGRLGNFPYVMETPVLFSLKDRPTIR